MSKNSSGFTLIELLVSLALSTILLTATIGVVGRIGRNADRITESKPDTWKLPAIARLRQEMQNGVSYWLADNRLTITGYSDRRYPSQQATLRKNEIRYLIGKEGDKHFLLREVASENGQVRNLVCDKVASIILRDAQGTDFKNRAGGFDQDVSMHFMDIANNELFSVSHRR